MEEFVLFVHYLGCVTLGKIIFHLHTLVNTIKLVFLHCLYTQIHVFEAVTSAAANYMVIKKGPQHPHLTLHKHQHSSSLLEKQLLHNYSFAVVKPISIFSR